MESSRSATCIAETVTDEAPLFGPAEKKRSNQHCKILTMINDNNDGGYDDDDADITMLNDDNAGVL